MNKKFKSVMAAVCTASMAASALCGCSNEKKTEDANHFSYWVELSGAASAKVSNYGETPFAKELQKRTGVTIDYQHPAQGQTSEKFNIMIASSNLPDIVEYNWANYPGGPGKAIKDGKIIKLNDYIEKYAPNLKKYLDEHKDVAKLCMTDDGDIFAFPFIRGDKDLCVSQGPVVRKDWLDDLGMELPETIDEWETMLTAFKEKKNAQFPLDMNTWPFTVGAFAGAYGTLFGYYIDNNEVKYGPYEAGFKDFVTKMNSWYNKGLLTPDIATIDGKAIDSDIISGKTGAVFGALGGGIGKWLAAKPDDKFDLVGAKYPVLKKGDKPAFNAAQSIVTGTFTAITTSCKNPDGAAKFLSYGYSDEGEMLYNFGIEGESYNMVDGYPTYTDLITKNEEGLAMSNMLALYTQSYSAGPFIQDKRYMEQYSSLPQQQAAWENWSVSDGTDRNVPYLYYTEEETSDIVKKSTAIDTYANEMICKFIMNIEPIDSWDKFTAELENRGIKDVLKAKQEAYNKYLNR